MLFDECGGTVNAANAGDRRRLPAAVASGGGAMIDGNGIAFLREAMVRRERRADPAIR